MDPLHDTRLSLRARGLYMLYKSLGEILPSVETQKLVPEGRDAIRSAMSELKEFGYIKEIRYQTAYGHWNVTFVFTEAWKTEDGFSGDLYRCTDCIANSDITLALFSNENKSSVSGAPKIEEEFKEMSWPIFEEEPKEVRAKGLPRFTEDEAAGAVGRLPADKKALRQEKYTKTKIEASTASATRSERPEADWTTNDLLAEFYDLARKAAPGAPGQINGKNLATWINQRVGEGTPRLAVLKAIRMFFEDPRLTRDPGVGLPMWRRFIAFYPTVHGIVTRVDNPTEDDKTMAHQAKMLKLLEN